MTNLILHPQVAADVTRGTKWYRDIDQELADCFSSEVYRIIDLAKAAPEQHSKIYRDFRSILCRRFPYKVVFEIVESDQAVHVIAVSHTSQHPDRWKSRI